MTENALAGETSPYLLQHKDNPVHWQPWGEQALARARDENKPILLSVGYAACHWCHVMAHESFENPDIAAQMNRDFINIKVDREERPDLDTIYQYALSALGQQGGWPLTMFLTPAGEPFWGGTYFRPMRGMAAPGFPQLLDAIQRAYHQDPETVGKNVAALKQALGRMSAPQAGEGLDRDILDQASVQLTKAIDAFHGGFGDAPKFPQVPLLETIWRGWKRTGEKAMRQAIELTLDHICQGGIYDHLGGGFARYATDARWLAPHFEKMLYDNALLIDFLTLVWQENKNPLYAQRIEETIGWVTREMHQPGGGFSSSLDADSEHEEGKFYVWDEAEIDTLLGARSPRFKEFYNVSAAGNWEEHNILNRLHHLGWEGDVAEQEFAGDRAILFAARAPRVRPGLDDKVLADWNGLMITALAHAGTVFKRPDWLALARDAFDFVVRDMGAGSHRLFHSWREGQARNTGMLDDYADMAHAALALYEAEGDERYLRQAVAWVEVAKTHFWDEANGGYFFAADDAEILIARHKTAHDSPNPSGNGVMVTVLARLFYLTGEDRFRDRAAALILAFGGEVRRNVFGVGALLNGSELLENALQIVLRGRRGEPDAEALLDVIREVSLPNKILSVLPPEIELPANHPAQGKGQVDGRATVYVCEGPVCSLPITDAAVLRVDLAAR